MKISIRGVSKDSFSNGIIGVMPEIDEDGCIAFGEHVTAKDLFSLSDNQIAEMISFTKWDRERIGTRALKRSERIRRLMKLGLYKPKPIVFDEEDDLPF